MRKHAYELVDPQGNRHQVIDLKGFLNQYNHKQSNRYDRVDYFSLLKPHKLDKNGQTYAEKKGWSIKKVLNTISTNTSENKNSTKTYDLTPEEKILKLSEENTRLKSQVKENIRDSSIFKELAGVISTVQPITNIPEYKPTIKKNAKIYEDVILVISDAHADQNVKSEGVNNLEEYNFHVACKRGERIVDTTISHLLENMQNYNFETLHIFLMGDLTSGEINDAVHHSETGNVIQNSLIIGEMLAQMITELAQKFKNINIVCLSGNHGRRTKKKEYCGPLNNFDFNVHMYIKTRLKNLIDQERVAIEIPNSWSAVVTIKGYTFVLNHGDSINSFNGLPWYGIERKTRRITSVNAVNGLVPNYFLYGHFHQSTSISNPTGETFVNGAWNATDEYALEGLGAYSEPTQWLFGVHETHGATWRLPIKLRTKNWKSDEKKPSRYKVDIF